MLQSMIPETRGDGGSFSGGEKKRKPLSACAVCRQQLGTHGGTHHGPAGGQVGRWSLTHGAPTVSFGPWMWDLHGAESVSQLSDRV